jgi:membrane-bound serine protease (ClpP class)
LEKQRLSGILRHHSNLGCERLRRLSAFFAFLLAFVPFQNVCSAQALPQEIVVVNISGTVDPGMAAFIERALSVSADDSNPFFVLEMDTFGGRVDSALQIVDTLLSAPENRTIAFVKNKAISAGALIALACSRLVMRQNTTIGDCAPISYSSEGPQMLGEKFQSPLRAKFRALAKRNGYPEALAESMVTAEMTVYAVEMDGNTTYMDSQAFEDLGLAEKEKVVSKKTIVAKGELLTMDDVEAFELGFSRMSVDTIDDMLQRMEIKNYQLIRIQESWSEIFVRFIGTIAPFLLMIGLASLYIEIKAPGFGVPGIIGITCLFLVFLNQYLVGLADYTEFLLLILGILLLGFEVFVIPGFGITGIAGLLFIAAGAILALQDFVIPDPSFPWQAELLVKNILHVLGALFVAVITALLSLRYLLPKLSVVFEGPYLHTTLKAFHADSMQAGSLDIGDTGIAVTLLRPSGKVKIKAQLLDVVAQGEFIKKGSPVKIVEIRGNRVIVSRAEKDE